MSLARFDEIAEFFDRATAMPLHRRLRAAAAAALRPARGRTVLDLGAGPGGLAADLLAEGARVIGLDGSLEMLRRAAARLAPRRSAAHLLRGDASRLPLREASVDDAAGVLVLHLLDDPVPALRECRRVCRPGARLAFVTQSDDFGPGAGEHVRGPLDPLEVELLEGCARSAASHSRLDAGGWEAAFRDAGLPTPLITLALPGVAWLVCARLPGGPASLWEAQQGEG